MENRMENRKRVREVKEVERPGKVKSRNNYPTTIKHNGVEIVISPRGSTMCDMYRSKLDPLLKGVVFCEN